jgi:hypothetical protein
LWPAAACSSRRSQPWWPPRKPCAPPRSSGSTTAAALSWARAAASICCRDVPPPARSPPQLLSLVLAGASGPPAGCFRLRMPLLPRCSRWRAGDGPLAPPRSLARIRSAAVTAAALAVVACAGRRSCWVAGCVVCPARPALRKPRPGARPPRRCSACCTAAVEMASCSSSVKNRLARAAEPVVLLVLRLPPALRNSSSSWYSSWSCLLIGRKPSHQAQQRAVATAGTDRDLT